MPISEESNKISYNTDGLIREFSFNFKFLQPSNIKVSFWTEDNIGKEGVALEEGKDYTLIYDDAEEGGFVVLIESSAEEQAQGKPKYPATPTSGTLLVARIMPLDQQAHIRPVSGFPEEVITNTFDKLVMIDQQQQEQLDRCVKVSDVSDINPEVLVQQVERIHAGIEDIAVVADHIEDVEYVAANGEDILKASEDSLANANAAKEQANIATEQANIATEQANKAELYRGQASQHAEEAQYNANMAATSAGMASNYLEAATEQANIAKEQKIIVEQLSQATNDILLEAQSIEQKVSLDLEVSKGYAQTALTQAGIATTQADIATARADEIKQYAANASISEANALNYASEASASAYNSEISERASEASANNSKIWAEGTDEEVQALGGVHSSKTWAEIGSDVGGKWGNILGDIEDQTDLQAVLDSKADVTDIPDLTDYVKNTDYATTSSVGLVKVAAATGINANKEGKIYISKAPDESIVAKTEQYRPLTPSNIDLAVKTGITTNTIELTDEEKANAKDWLGISGGREVGEFVRGFWSADYVPENLLYCDGTEFSGAEGQMFRNLYVDYLTGEITQDAIVERAGVSVQNGIASFSHYSYFFLRFPLTSSSVPYGDFNITFTTGDDVTTEQFIWDFVDDTSFVNIIKIANGYFKTQRNNVDTNIIKAEANTTYTLRFTAGLVVSLIKSGVETVISTASMCSSTHFWFFANAGSSSSYPANFLGTADLTASKYTNANGVSVPLAKMQSKLDTCTYAEYETELTMTGSCYKWAVNTANQKFRIPFIPDKLSERFLVEKKEPTETDPTWYNLYSDGWCEQGGITIPSSSTANKVVTLLKPYINTNYSVVLGNQFTGGATAVSCVVTSTKTTDGFTIADAKNASYYTQWEAKGYIDFSVEKTIRHYVVVATGSINKNEADWSEFASSLQGKANTDLSNVETVSQSFKDLSMDWGLPDYSAIVSVGNTTRTTETNVVVLCDKSGYNSVGTITIEGHTFNVSKADPNGNANHTYRDFYMAKGTTYTTVKLTEVLEIPLRGVK